MTDTTERLLVTHMGHDGPWLLLKTRDEIDERKDFILANKFKIEHAARLVLIRIVDAPLPAKLREAKAKLQEADAKRQEADAKWQVAEAKWLEAYARWREAEAKRLEANMKWLEANTKWQVAINSPEGVAFHAKVCGCPWSLEHQNVLEGLARP